MNVPLANLMFAPDNWLLVGGIALLLFGKRLPEIGRSLGKGIVEFKKGLAGVEEGVVQASRQPTIARSGHAALPSLSAPYKFDPYTGKPAQEGEEVDPDN